MQTISKLSCKQTEDINDIPNFSLMCIQLHDIDCVENKEEILNIFVKKLRKDGEIIIDFKNFTRILNLYLNKELSYREMFDIVKNLPHQTSYDDIFNFCNNNNSIKIYKVIEEKTMDIISLTRTGY
tara:strand:- start:732 stop:1109 length:378 start_codon:yes stop_codon:yes gene_type:complete